MPQQQRECFICPDCEGAMFDPRDVKEGFCQHCGDWTRQTSEPVYITEREDC